MRLGFAVAAHLEADVLLLDEVFAVGDEEFQRKCFGKIFEFKQRGGTIVFVSHDAAAVERLCERAVLLRAGRVEFDGPTHEAIVALPPAARGRARPGRARRRALREWGSGEARVADVELLGAEGEPRAAVPAPASRSRCGSASSPSARCPRRGSARAARRVGPARRRRRRRRPAELGWPPGGGEARVRFEVDRLPLADGRFHLRLGLVGRGRAGCCTSSTTRRPSSSVPEGDERGFVRLEGRWTREEIAAAAELPRDELAHVSGLAAS